MSQQDGCTCDYCRRMAAPIDRIDDRLVADPEVQAFLGDVGHMWVRRREGDPQFRFPRPVYIGRYRRRWAGDLVAWVQSPHAQLRTGRNFKGAA